MHEPGLLAVKRDHSQSFTEERFSQELMKLGTVQFSSGSGWCRWSEERTGDKWRPSAKMPLPESMPTKLSYNRGTGAKTSVKVKTNDKHPLRCCSWSRGRQTLVIIVAWWLMKMRNKDFSQYTSLAATVSSNGIMTSCPASQVEDDPQTCIIQ